MKSGSRFRNVLFWSIISAAFIGPGTVATAARAGAQFGTALIWALIFSTLATIVLQEMASRLTIETGRSLGEHLRIRFPAQPWLPVVIWAVVAFGCAAYEAGNILGAVAGSRIVLGAPEWVFTVLISCFAWLLIARGSIRLIGQVLGCVVAVMGMAFIAVAIGARPALEDLMSGSFIPTVPEGSLLLIIALVGTTIVPYNLFLGSGVSKGHSLRSMRAGLPLAILLGGLISIAILIAGTLVIGEMQFDALAQVLEDRLGLWGRYLMGIGLLAAGMTSAITAPLAAALTAQGVFPSWTRDTTPFKAVWGLVLAIGCTLGLLHLQPIPVIIAAQALNGILLPVVVIALYDISFRTFRGRIPGWYATVAWVVVCVVTFLGCNSLLAALTRVGLPISDDVRMIIVLALVGSVGVWLLFRRKNGGVDRTSRPD